jgi:hypothetical protein
MRITRQPRGDDGEIPYLGYDKEAVRTLWKFQQREAVQTLWKFQQREAVRTVSKFRDEDHETTKRR